MGVDADLSEINILRGREAGEKYLLSFRQRAQNEGREFKIDLPDEKILVVICSPMGLIAAKITSPGWALQATKAH